MEVSPALVVSGIGAAIAIAGYFHNRFVYQAGLEGRLTRLETQVQPFIKALESMAVQILHHPTQPERDALLEKFEAGTLTRDEKFKLKAMMVDVIDDYKSLHKDVTAALIISASLTAQLGQKEKR